jgi:hypothetical protein
MNSKMPRFMPPVVGVPACQHCFPSQNQNSEPSLSAVGVLALGVPTACTSCHMPDRHASHMPGSKSSARWLPCQADQVRDIELPQLIAAEE